MNKVILILLDGLNAQTANNHMGFLQHLIENNLVAAYTVRAELPAQSRPLYEVIQTGVSTYVNGIVSNWSKAMSKEKSVFQLAKESGLVTGAASYYWISELYNKSPFDPFNDRFQLNTDLDIQNGIFYFEDYYPDNHLIADGAFLINQMKTDYTLIHTMNIDYTGHKFGSKSKEYVQSTVAIDSIISNYIMDWIKDGYQIVITADHGMNEYFTHNALCDDDTKIPLYIFSDKVIKGDYRKKLVSQLQIAPLLCHLLGIEKSDAMQDLKFI